MPDYTYANDGKIHTRYSELIRCTPGQIESVLAERAGRRRIETEDMGFGITRHEMWQEEALKSHRIPSCFRRDWPASHIEHEFATEVLPGVVVHSRPDIVCADTHTIPDYKTIIDGVNGWKHNLDTYRHNSKQRQLKFYAFQVGLHGMLIRKGAFLCEIWNKQRSAILGYEVIEFDISLSDMAAALQWLKPRAAMLASALETAGKLSS